MRERQVETLGEYLAAAREAAPEEFTVENDVMSVRFSTRGGQVTGVTLKDYRKYAPRKEEGRPVEMMDPETAQFGMTFYVKNGLNNVDVNTLDYVFDAAPVETAAVLWSCACPFPGMRASNTAIRSTTRRLPSVTTSWTSTYGW